MQTNMTRGLLWSDVETRTLLKIWGEQDIQAALEENFRNSFVYRDVSRRLGGMGFERTPEQCRMRIKSLKRQYLLAKEGNLRNNGQYHKICKFYDTMERILSNRPPHDPQEFIDSGAGGEEASDGMEEDAEDAQDGFSESTTECAYPAETEVKLEYPTVPIPIPVKVTVGNTSKCLHFVMNENFISTWLMCLYIHVSHYLLIVPRFRLGSETAEQQPARLQFVSQSNQAAQEAAGKLPDGEADGAVPGAERAG